MSEDKSDLIAEGAGFDILFDCPACGKSLEIDARGAGHIVTCPDCKHEVEIPALDTAQGEDLLMREPSEGDLQAEVERLRRVIAADGQYLQRIGEEMQLIQAALDRINQMIESRSR